MNLHAWTLDLVVPGERLDSDLRRPCQDHAVARATEHGCVVAVSDGVSLVGRGVRSATQCGAVLVAEVAAAAALAELADRARHGDVPGPCRVELRVREELEATLARLVEHLRRLAVCTDVPRAHRKMLCGTLLLGVRTPAWSAVWAVGDGMAGVVVDAAVDAVGRDRDRGSDPAAVRVGSCQRRAVVWGKHLACLSLGDVLPEAVLGDGEHKPSGLRRVLEVEGPSEAIWVATDGLCQEWPLALKLVLRGFQTRREVLPLLQRGPSADDLAVAAAADLGWALTPECEVRP